MIGYLEIIRPSVVLLAAIAVFVGAFLSGFSSYPIILIAIISASLIAAGGNALNDYFDYRTDRINKPHRAIPSGRVKREDILIYSSILLILGFILSFFLTLSNIFLALLNIFVVIAYNAFLKRIPLIGNFSPSWLAASSFIYGGFLTSSISSIVILLFSIAFLANTGREIVKAIEDVVGDTRTDFKTLPVVAGKTFSILTACIFIILAIVFSMFPYVFNLLGNNYLVFVIIADLLFFYSLFHISNSAKKSQNIMKIAMFVAMVAFIAGAL
jgi:geranylgeranylglycerol-phosphate geranylgeranyltransferase